MDIDKLIERIWQARNSYFRHFNKEPNSCIVDANTLFQLKRASTSINYMITIQYNHRTNCWYLWGMLLAEVLPDLNKTEVIKIGYMENC